MVAAITQVASDLVGTAVPTDAPLMGAGLDSVAAVELVSTLCQHLSTEVEPTALFDHPTIGSLGAYFTSLLRPMGAKNGRITAPPPAETIIDKATHR